MKPAWIAAFVLAVLFLATAITNPLWSGLYAALLFAAGIGIRWYRHPWAAIAPLILFAPLTLLALVRARWTEAWPSLLIGLVVGLLVLAIFARGAAQLLRLPPDEARRAGWAKWGWIVAGALAVMPWLVLRPFVIPTGSMADTILIGDQLLVDQLSPFFGWRPARGDIIAFEYPIDRRQSFISRVIGIPGDRIRISRKQLVRNGVVIDEPFALHKTEYFDDYRDGFPAEPNVRLYEPARRMLAEHVRDGEVVVPDGHYFVMGDNRDSSLDSRYWGFLPASAVFGRPVLIYNSLHSERSGDESWPKPIRWNRLLRVVH